MGYKLLGMAVWNLAKLFLRQKYVSTKAPKPLLAGGLLAVAVGIVLAALRSRGGDG